MTFRVGQKVVCVDARDTNLIKDKVYTISAVYLILDWNDEYGVSVAGVKAARGLGGNTGFRASLFRPAVERKTDIGFAHEILRKVAKSAPSPLVTSNKCGG